MNRQQNSRTPRIAGWLHTFAGGLRSFDLAVLRHPITVGLVVAVGGPALLAYLGLHG